MARRSDWLFSDAVFDAELPDFGFADAFLPGLEMRALATGDEAGFAEDFPGRLVAQEDGAHFDDEADFGMKSFRGQIEAFKKGSPDYDDDKVPRTFSAGWPLSDGHRHQSGAPLFGFLRRDGTPGPGF